MWDRINLYLDTGILFLLRFFNAIIFVISVLYLGEELTGIDIGTIFVIIGTITSIFYDSEKNFILVIAKKIMKFGWGLSFLLFCSIVLFLWNTKENYLNNFKFKFNSWLKNY